MKKLLVLALVCFSVICCNKEIDDDNDNIDSSSVGCKDISARNYDSSATINDHCLCEYEMPCDYTLITQNYDTTGDVRFILPNAVTSNTDGQNDNWRPIFGQGIDSAHYSIYDGISHLYDEKKNNDSTWLTFDGTWLTFDSIVWGYNYCALGYYQQGNYPIQIHKYQFHVKFYSIHGEMIEAEGEFVEFAEHCSFSGYQSTIYNCCYLLPDGTSSANGTITDGLIPDCIP